MWFYKRSVDAVHLVVKTTGVTQVVTGTVSPPQRSRDGATVNTLAAFARKFLQHICKNKNEKALFSNRHLKHELKINIIRFRGRS